MIIRVAQPADCPHILELVTNILVKEFPSDQSVYTTEDLTHLMETYKGPQSTFLVAEQDRQIVGACGVKAESQETAILRRFFVEPRSRGRGIGLRLLKEALQFCSSQGFREVVIRTSTRMERAIRMCCSLGFQEDGRWALGQITLIRFRLRLMHGSRNK